MRELLFVCITGYETIEYLYIYIAATVNQLTVARGLALEISIGLA